MFQYKVPRSSKFTKGTTLQTAKVPEVLRGVLQGKKVPQDEERFYKGAMRTGKVRAYYVQFDLGVRGLPGYRTLDALVNTNFGWRAFEIDGSAFVHRGDRKKAEDRLADYQRLNHLRDMGIFPRMGIEHVSDRWLQNQDDANRKAREMLG